MTIPIVASLPRWTRRLKTIASFGLADWRLIAEASVVLLAADVARRLVAPRRVLAWATSVSPRPPLDDAAVRRLARFVAIAANYHLLRMRCLARSLALARMLGRRGVATDVRLGVRTAEGHFSAHAWVEWRGRPLNDDAHVHERFAAFERPLGEISNV